MSLAFRVDSMVQQYRGDGAATAIDPVTSTTVYASVAATGITTPIYKSTDGAHFDTSDPEIYRLQHGHKQGQPPLS